VSTPFAFICTKTSAAFVIPERATDVADLARRLRIFSQGLVGGVLEAGTVKLRATQDEIPNHLLCDGSAQHPLRFPDLFAVIGTTFGGDGVDTFNLPDYSGALTIATPTVTQTVSASGTVSTDATVVTDAGDVGGTTGGNVISGGRLPRLRPGEQEP
jgi:hypothetical protein